MTIYTLKPTTRFKKDLRLAKKRGYDMALIEEVIDLLVNGKTLPERYKDHSLRGKLKSARECHITPDWLLIYERDEHELILYLTRTGTHAELFGL